MNAQDPTERADARLSQLSAAILRISQSLELATVLKEVVESARAPTGARAGVARLQLGAEQRAMKKSGVYLGSQRYFGAFRCFSWVI